MRIVADSQIPFIKEYFGPCGELILKPGRTISHADVKDADVLLVRSITHVNKKLLDNTAVRFVGSVTAGADHLDTVWLDEAQIKWSVATGFNALPVADYVICIVAALQKHLQTQPLNVAVIGIGNVGRLVVERFKLLNFAVTLCDPIRKEEEDFNSVPLEEIRDMDLISLHVPLTKKGNYPTYHFIDKNFLQHQKPGCVLLNASRGSVINSHDLLTCGSHLLWCFDVWENEPTINKEILKQSLIATPHIAGYSLQSKMRGIEMIYRIAVAKNMIQPPTEPLQTMPKQRLAFSGENLSWQDIVLGVFNPLVINSIMRTVLLEAEDSGPLFDDMRNQFNYRHEFGFTNIEADVSSSDKKLLEKFGLTVSF